ncbi:MAG TPA: hypothetical protein VFL91_25410, partial [Thermomicrobiales bacterium]|nr:hypothetical protein [Thermomicrobiales bacterium]
LVVLAGAPGFFVGGAGVLLVGGVALPATHAVGAIWVNERSASDVRATVQSLLAQAEYGGEILGGLALAALAQLAAVTVAFACAAALIAWAGLLVVRSHAAGG